MRARRVLAGTVLALATAAAALTPGPTAAAAPPRSAPAVDFTAALNGRDVETIDTDAPLRLVPRDGADVVLTATNRGRDPVTLRSVRLDARVFGLTFFKYTARIDLELPPGRQDSRHFLVDTDDLAGQATGLLPARMTLFDGNRRVIGTRTVPVDVRGSLWSVYGVFGIAMAAATALLVAALVIGLVTRQLPVSRWVRALRFAVPGLGLGLTLTFALSAFRVLTPSPDTWLTMVLGAGVAAFGLGFLSPGPEVGAGPEEVPRPGTETHPGGYAPDLAPPRPR